MKGTLTGRTRLPQPGAAACRQARRLSGAPLLAERKEFAEKLGMPKCVELPGHVGDRDTVPTVMRDGHMLKYCQTIN